MLGYLRMIINLNRERTLTIYNLSLLDKLFSKLFLIFLTTNFSSQNSIFIMCCFELKLIIDLAEY